MPNWVALQKMERAKPDVGASRLRSLELALANRREVDRETVAEFLARGGKIQTVKKSKK